MADDTPKVNKRGLLTKPHPIRNRGDVSRARVLPMPEASSDAPAISTKAPDAPKAPARDRSLDRPEGGFDYIRKRNAASRALSGRR